MTLREIFSKQEKKLKVARESQLKEFYICSFSSRSIVYKGMFLAEMLSEFYPDLNDEKLPQGLQYFIKDTLQTLFLAGI